MRFALRTCAVTIALISVAATAEPLAGSLLGHWICAPKDGSESFSWIVSEKLPGGWLVGEGVEDGELTSLETWAFNASGQLMERRQFSPAGAFIHLSVVERSSRTIRSSGRRTSRDGEVVAVRHRLHVLDTQHFEATWEANDGSGWRIVADEICSLSNE